MANQNQAAAKPAREPRFLLGKGCRRVAYIGVSQDKRYGP